MLDTVNLDNKTEKDEYKEIIKSLEMKMGELQRRARQAGIPVVVVFEGWDAAGKGTLINRLLLSMDARGYTVNSISAPNEEERLRPFLWRFWTRIPAQGRIGVFDRSWYGRVLVERMDKIAGKDVWRRAYEEIRSFERRLTDSGIVIVKFFLHISKKEQKKRFKTLEKNPALKWKVTEEDWRHHEQYDKRLKVTEEMLVETDTEFAPWTIVEAHDRRFAEIKVFSAVIASVENKLNHLSAVAADEDSHKKETLDVSISSAESHASQTILDTVDLSLTLSRKDYDKALGECQSRIHELEHEAYLKRLPVIIAYEGCDAAGKGGAIRRLVQALDPRGYDVIPVGAPNDVEKDHHYLWRFWREVPKAGHIAIFDRSWYGRVLVERVEGFCTEEEWRRAYREINEMEEQWFNFGAAVIKFWFQTSKDEQLARFTARKNTPGKEWKITEEDWRNREKWDQYQEATADMLRHTSTLYAPWTIVEAEDKLYARIKSLRTVIEVMEKML